MRVTTTTGMLWGVGAVIVAAAVLLGVDHFCGGRLNPNAAVGGASLANCENCTNQFSSFEECYHETMDPNVLCSTTACIENKHWYIECTSTCEDGDCDYHIDANQLFRWQERKYQACAHSGENPFWRQQSNACAPSKGEYVRCITTGCKGTSWGTSPMYGREVCGL